jgi:hypothetical protein
LCSESLKEGEEKVTFNVTLVKRTDLLS